MQIILHQETAEHLVEKMEKSGWKYQPAASDESRRIFSGEEGDFLEFRNWEEVDSFLRQACLVPAADRKNSNVVASFTIFI